MVQYKETGNVQEDIAQLAQAPDLEWMAEIADRDDVDWQAVQEVHDHWKKTDSGIGGPGMGASVAADAADTVGLNPTDSTGDSASVGMGKGTGSSAWVHNQTSIIGKEQVDIRVEDNTHVAGAVIAAENGNLKLDTDTLTYNDIYDHDKASNYQASVSVSKSAENAKNSANRQGSDNAQAGSSQEGASNDANKDAKQEGNPYSGTLDGSASSHDRRQINRATIGEGEIIIRSDPDAGLEGLNRDLAKAQEITRDEKTSVSVYIDSAAIEEIMSGGEGIKNNFNKVAEKIKELLPEDAERMREVIQSQQVFRDQLAKEIDPDEADRILGENAVAAVLKVKLDKYVTESGELNITEEEAEDLLNELRSDPTVVLQVASTWDYDLQTERARLQRQLFSIVGIAKSAGATAKGALMFLNDYSGEIFYFATRGTSFKAEHERFHETVNEVVAAIGKLATDPGGTLKAIGQVYNGRLDQYYKLVEEGKHDEAGLVMGSLMYDVAEVLAVAGKGILKGAKKLAGLLKKTAVFKYTAKQLAIAEKLGISAKWVKLDGNLRWPDADGFLNGVYKDVTLQPGTVIDRYGADTGNFFSPLGTPFEERALPANRVSDTVRKYEVLRPLPVQEGVIAPWFDQPGGGTQFKMGMTAKQLVKEGYIREVK